MTEEMHGFEEDGVRARGELTELMQQLAESEERRVGDPCYLDVMFAMSNTEGQD